MRLGTPRYFVLGGPSSIALKLQQLFVAMDFTLQLFLHYPTEQSSTPLYKRIKQITADKSRSCCSTRCRNHGGTEQAGQDGECFPYLWTKVSCVDRDRPLIMANSKAS